jgi:hypothetical protein
MIIGQDPTALPVSYSSMYVLCVGCRCQKLMMLRLNTRQSALNLQLHFIIHPSEVGEGSQPESTSMSQTDLTVSGPTFLTLPQLTREDFRAD